MTPELLEPPGLDEQAIAWACEGAGATTTEALVGYQDDPLGFAVDILGERAETYRWSEHDAYAEHEWDGDRDPFVSAWDALCRYEDVGIESGTGTGKTRWLADTVLWFLGAFEDSIVVTAAPKEDQLLMHVWKEIGKLWPRFNHRFPDAEYLKSGKIRMAAGEERWAATAFVAGVGADEASATKAQGFHAKHMLIITEETPGMHSAMMTAFENTCTAPHNLRLAVGNPDHREDQLHRFCGRDYVTNFRVSALDHPNVVRDDPEFIPGAVSAAAIDRRKILYEHLPAMYQSRVRGISPEMAAGVVLRKFSDANLQVWTDQMVGMVKGQDWPVWAAYDMGDWRSAFLVGVVDRGGRMHIVEERFWHLEADEAESARQMHDLLEKYGADKNTRIITDRKSAHSVKDLNKQLQTVGSPYRAKPVFDQYKQREASVRRLNWLFGEGKLILARDLGAMNEWRLGMKTDHQGEPMTGSRLKWEIRHWRYPEAREGKAQTQDPDDDTADGADAIAALRYMTMAWWLEGAEYALPDEPENPNRDYGLERRMKRLNEQRERALRRWV